MVGVVAPAVTEVDAADEGDVLLRPALPAYDEELLVVGPAAAHSLVEERLAAALVDDGAEVVVLLAVEPARVGAPQQARTSTPRRDADAGPRRPSGRPRSSFVGVAAPVGQEDPVAGPVAPITSRRRAK